MDFGFWLGGSFDPQGSLVWTASAMRIAAGAFCALLAFALVFTSRRNQPHRAAELLCWGSIGAPGDYECRPSVDGAVRAQGSW